MRRFFPCLFAFVLLPIAASAQQPGPLPKPKNLKFFPKDIPPRALIDTMHTFTTALGVRCTYCHVEKPAVAGERPEMDFAADTKVEKRKARVMLQMVAAINGNHLTKLESRRQPPVVVSCATCHRGVAVPRPLQQVVLMAYDSSGADSAIATYRALRAQYYGRAAYDFGDAPLADVGSALRARQKFADAVRFYLLNTEYSPTSPFAFRQAGEGQLAAGDTVAAIASFEHALMLEPKNMQLQRMLDSLKAKPRP
jgi:photosynthetic reaction center cytochrome c subunit